MSINLYIKIGFLWFLKHVNILPDAQISTDPGQEAFCALREVLTASPKMLKGSPPSPPDHGDPEY